MTLSVFFWHSLQTEKKDFHCSGETSCLPHCDSVNLESNMLHYIQYTAFLLMTLSPFRSYQTLRGHCRNKRDQLAKD